MYDGLEFYKRRQGNCLRIMQESDNGNIREKGAEKGVVGQEGGIRRRYKEEV